MHRNLMAIPANNSTLRIILYLCINGGSYMSACVLLNLFNELRKSDKIRGLPSI